MATAAAMTGTEAARYTRVAVALHWIIAALIVLNLLLGLFHDDFAKASRASVMMIHKSTGFTVLALSLARLAWRLTHRPPAPYAALRPWERMLAAATHWLFYVLMIALPLSGWILSSGGGRATRYFGTFSIPPLGVSKVTGRTFGDVHEWLGWTILLLLVLHVAGALKHHFAGPRDYIGRMAPWGARR
jgi:cytochrome b561